MKKKRSRPRMVVLDANVWVREQLLKSPRGVAFLYSLRRMNAHIGLVDMTEAEAIKGIARRGEEAIEGIKKNYRFVHAIVGTLNEYSLPDKSRFERNAEERFAELEDVLHRIKLSFKQCKSALRRVIAGSPPNTEDREQFRDSLLWEAVLKLVRRYEVHFITGDTDFYQDRSFSKGLARDLDKDVETLGGSIAIYTGLEKYLESVQESLEGPDPREVAALIDRQIRDDLRNDAKKGDYSLGELVDQEMKVFLTEQHNLLALNFKLRYRIFDLPEERYGFLPEVFLQVSGNCFYNVTLAEVSNVEIDETRGITPTGELVRGIGAINLRVVFGFGEGRREIPYTLRSEIKSH